MGWLRELTTAVVRKEITGFEILCKNFSEGGWELVSVAELGRKISLNSREFGGYLNDFSVQVNNFEVFEWVKVKFSKQSEDVDSFDNIPLPHLLIIAALLDLLKENDRLNHTQATLTEEIDKRFKNVSGVSVSTMEKLFPLANKAMGNARKQSEKK